MEIVAQARIVMWQGASLWIVDAKPGNQRATRQTDFHAHHAIQLTVRLGGRFRVSSGQTDIEGSAAAVAADVSHRFEAEGLIAIIFIEPESRSGRAISQNMFGEARAVEVPAEAVSDLAQKIADAYRAPVRNDENLAALGSALVVRLAGGVSADVPDLRIRKVIAWAAARLDQPLSLSGAVGLCGLSAGRLRHLFVEQTGLQFRTYLLWLRLSRGVALLVDGHTLTQAAHEAGFADSAHFSRTFRRMFGIAPTNLRIA